MEIRDFQLVNTGKPTIISHIDEFNDLEKVLDMASESGFYLPIDKSLGSTSFSLIAKARKALGIKKIGHAGTLDPLATGLVVLAVGKKATKTIDSLMDSRKVYNGKMVIGLVSDTDDAEGPIADAENIFRCDNENNLLYDLEKIKINYLGDILQIPPRFSAKKINGKRMYKMARKGEDFQPRPTLVNVGAIEFFNPKLATILDITKSTLTKYMGNLAGVKYNRYWTVDFSVECGKGTYIRSLVRDIGRDLGSGAYMTELRRTRSGNFHVEKSLSEEELIELIEKRA
ncbi:MAG: hypothetical protein Kapaf2KO_21980 [Candidatus Kapaibacteriales bacterium]